MEATIRTPVLYKAFWPDTPKGKAGWGQSGMFRLGKVIEVRNEILSEMKSVKP